MFPIVVHQSTSDVKVDQSTNEDVFLDGQAVLTLGEQMQDGLILRVAERAHFLIWPAASN
jgi:hypothetical protein